VLPDNSLAPGEACFSLPVCLAAGKNRDCPSEA
jgi:hypothetical protein